MLSLKNRIWILAALFALTLGLGLIGNPNRQSAEEQGGVWETASLPVLAAEWNGQLIDPLYGYTDGSCAGTDNDTLYPFMGDNLSFVLHLLNCQTRPSEVSYELRTEDESRLLERGEAGHLSGVLHDLYCTISFQDLMQEGELYRLRVTLTLESATVVYSLRVCRLTSQSRIDSMTAMIEYANTLHDSLFDRTAAYAYSGKLEPSDEADQKTLAHVDINSSFNQFAWGSSGAAQTSDSWLSLHSFDEGIGSFTFRYLVQASAGEDATATLRVKESMTLQYSSGRMYLLTYDRDAEQLWEPDELSFQKKGILVGVQQEDNSVLKSADGNVTAFTAGGELYTYMGSEARLTRLFTFRTEGEAELRTLCRSYDIRILSVENDGSAEFIVYGYMGSGLREGQCGICYYRYDPARNSLEELLYIASDKCYELLRQDVETLFVRSNEHFLYFYLDEQVYVMDFTSGETAVLIKPGEIDSLVIREDGLALAWKPGGDRSIRVMNLEKGTSELVEAEEGCDLQALGFIREDLVVGCSTDSAPVLETGLEAAAAMDSLRILDEELEEILEYGYEGIFISSVVNESTQLRILRFGWEGDSYHYLDDDVMLRSDAEEDVSTGFQNYTHETLMRMKLVLCDDTADFSQVTYVKCEGTGRGEALELPSSGESSGKDEYLAYGRGGLLGSFSVAGEALAAAGEAYGYVTDRAGQLIWHWTAKGRSVSLETGYPLREGSRTGAMDLRGASSRQLMGLLDGEQPLLWVSPDRGEQWVIGYDWSSMLLWDPVTEASYTLSQTEFDELTGRNDNYLWAFSQ